MSVYIGIDFSINSPGVCIKKDDKYTFISFYNSWGKTFENKMTKNMEIPFSLSQVDNVEIE